MKHKGIAVWLIPSEFMEVNYGRALKQFLTENVTLLQIHRFDPKDAQFSDALVTSSIVIIQNSKPKKNHTVNFTFGSDLNNPKIEKLISLDALKRERKWTKFPNKEVSPLSLIHI